MAIRRKPKLLTQTGEEISVARWIECNPEADFGTAVFEIDYVDDNQDIRRMSHGVIDVEGEQYEVKFNRFFPADKIWVSGRISESTTAENEASVEKRQ